MLEWSLSDRSMFAWIIPREHQRDDRRYLEVFNSAMFVVVVRPLFKFHCMDVCRCYLCPLNDILDINKNILALMLGLKYNGGKPYSNKQIYVKPEVNRCCSLELASHCQPQQSRLCRKYSCTTTWQFPNRVTHTWDPNVMFNCSCAAWQRRNPESSTLLTLCDGYPPMTGNSPHKGPAMCKAFPCHYVIKDELVSMG